MQYLGIRRAKFPMAQQYSAKKKVVWHSHISFCRMLRQPTSDGYYEHHVSNWFSASTFDIRNMPDMHSHRYLISIPTNPSCQAASVEAIVPRTAVLPTPRGPTMRAELLSPVLAARCTSSASWATAAGNSGAACPGQGARRAPAGGAAPPAGGRSPGQILPLSEGGRCGSG